jgi:TetR/AcrR family transcriptional repressor of nem operon
MERSKHQDTRERILAIGECLILARGFSALGLSELLSKAEVPKGSFYHYFRSKEDFGVALLERYFAGCDAGLHEQFANQNQPGKELVLGYFRNWMQKQMACDCHHFCLAVKLAAEVSDLSEPMRQALATGMNQIIRCIATVLQQEKAAGRLHKSEPGDLAEALYGMWVGASLLARVNSLNDPLERVYRQTQLMLESVGG